MLLLYIGGVIASLLIGVIYKIDEQVAWVDVIFTSILWPLIFSYGVMKRIFNWEDHL